jgi:hypothetical protein
MGETSDTIVQEIAQSRNALDWDLSVLEQRLKHEAKERVRAGKHALLVAVTTLGCLVAMGFLIRRIRAR